MEVRLFGPLELEVNGRLLKRHQFGGVKARQILEILAVHRGRVVAKAALAERLWPERAPVSVEAAIETHVSLLRRALGEPGAVETAIGGYRLGPVRVDLDVFDDLVARGTMEDLRTAISIVRAEVGQHDPGASWFRRPREQYGMRLTEALSRAGRLALEQGLATAAIDYSRRALARDPLREFDYQTLMAAENMRGDRAAGLRVFEQCRQNLRRQLGADPGTLSNSIHRGVLLGLPLELALGPLPGTIRRALVVESEGSLQGAMVQACGDAGYLSELVVDLQSALTRLAERRYDLVLVGASIAAVASLEAAAGRAAVVAAGETGKLAGRLHSLLPVEAVTAGL